MPRGTETMPDTPKTLQPLKIRQLPWRFQVPCVLVILLAGLSMTDTTSFSTGVKHLNDLLFTAFGSFYLWFVWLTMLGFITIGLSPLGRIRLGGDTAQPEHGFLSWFAMLFCAGMGTGFMFWGSAEPLYHFMNPPLAGVVGESAKDALALRYTFFHWGLSPWAIYGMTALALGFWGFNLDRGFFFSAFFLPPQEENQTPTRKILRGCIDFVTLLAIIFGISTTIGMGTLQIEGGLTTLLGWPAGLPLEALILLAVTAAFITSTLKGLEKGIKVLSNANLWLSILLMAIIVMLGPAHKMLSSFLNAMPAYLLTIPDMSLGLGSFTHPRWVADWTVKYWSWWIAWAPFVGLFIAFISKGRTVRELVLGVMLAPMLFSALWFSIFGETAIHYQTTEAIFGNTLNLKDVSVILYTVLNHLSQAPVLAWLSLVLVAINFINSADSATYTISTLSTRDLHQTPPPRLQLAWGLLFSALAGLLLMSGGIEILQEVTLVTVLPFSLLLAAVFIILIKAMIRYQQKQ